jgi:hypothetical protein
MMHRRRIRFGALAVLLFALATLWPMRPARAAGVVGTGTPASCTEAALDAALNGGGTVTFNCGAAPPPIIITNPKVITTDTTIDGGGHITLSGDNATRLFTVSKATLNLNNIILSNGHTESEDGGAIANSGTLIIHNSQLLNNTTGKDYGGGIYNHSSGSGATHYYTSTVELTNAILSGNSTAYGGGGGLYNDSGKATLINVTLNNNRAAGHGVASSTTTAP